jgi:hypothetical protein
MPNLWKSLQCKCKFSEIMLKWQASGKILMEWALLNIIIRILGDRFARMKVCTPYGMRKSLFLIIRDAAFLHCKLVLKFYQIFVEDQLLKLYRMFGLVAICYYVKDHEVLWGSTNEVDYRLLYTHSSKGGMIQDQLFMLLRLVQ